MAFTKAELKKFTVEIEKIAKAIVKDLDPACYHQDPGMSGVGEWRFSDPNWCVMVQFHPEVHALIAYFGEGKDVNYSLWNSNYTSETNRLATGINTPLKDLEKDLKEDLKEMEEAILRESEES